MDTYVSHAGTSHILTKVQGNILPFQSFRTHPSDKVEFVSIRVENSWNKRTPPLLQEFKNSTFVLEAFSGERPTEPLVDPPIKSHSDQSDLGIFDLTFLTIAWVIHSEVGQLLGFCGGDVERGNSRRTSRFAVAIPVCVTQSKLPGCHAE